MSTSSISGVSCAPSFLRAQKIDLSGRTSWCEGTDPEFVAKAAESVGLYMAPPDNAVVLLVDEKPSIQVVLQRLLLNVSELTGRFRSGHIRQRARTIERRRSLEL